MNAPKQTKVLILCSSRPAIMVRGDMVVKLCPDMGFRRLQIVFSRKTHLAEVDTRIAKYLTSIFDDVTLYKPTVPVKEKVVNDKGRDSTTTNP